MRGGGLIGGVGGVAGGGIFGGGGDGNGVCSIVSLYFVAAVL